LEDKARAKDREKNEQIVKAQAEYVGRERGD
jgi:hypothetical protein